MSEARRTIAHFDVDAFYASVEIRDRPALKGKPVAVAGRSRRAVVLTASYEARPFGVRSALPLYRARELCPDLIVVPPDMAKYRAVSAEIFALFRARGHPVEGLSLDEAFIDFGDVGIEAGQTLAQHIRAEAKRLTGMTLSAGVASSKMVAKIASDTCKPDGLLAIAAGSEAEFLAPLPVGRLWGIGPKTQARLAGLGILTIAQIAALDAERLRTLFGSWGREVGDLARGRDARAVQPERPTKSISSEETFDYDVSDERRLLETIKLQALEIAAKLEREGLIAGTVGIKIKRHDFTTLGRQTHLSEPTRDARRIYRAAKFCLRRAALGDTPVRLLGTRVASLSAGEAIAPTLFERTWEGG